MTIAIGTVEGRWVWNGTRWSCAMPPASPPTPPCPPGTGPFIPPASVDVPQFANVAAVTVANIPCGSTIRTLGYYTAGDGGGATYMLAPVQSNAMDGNIQSKDGQWWQYVPESRGVNCKSFGAKADAVDATPLVSNVYGPVTITGTDNTAFIQSAINFALRNKVRTVFLLNGQYLVASTLHLGWGDWFYSVNLEGDWNSGARYGVAQTVIMFTAVNMQCVNVAGARSNIIRGIMFFYPRNYYWIINNIANVRPSDPIAVWGPLPAAASGWCDPGLTQALSANAPIAAITVDAFAGAAPATPYPPVTFPAWTGLSGQYNKNFYSSNVQLFNCSFFGWPVGFVLGLNTNLQGDFTIINECIINSCAFGVSINNSQSRNVDVKNINFQYVNTLLDSVSFGMKNGEWSGPVSNLSGGESYQIFNFGTAVGPMEINNVYCEGGLRRFGQLFSYASLMLRNWYVTFADSQYEASRALVETFVYGGEVTFERCRLSGHYGLQNLCYGNATRTALGRGNYLDCGSRFTGTAVLGWQAQAYGGGFLMNCQAPYPAAMNKVRGTQTVYAPNAASNRLLTYWADNEPSGYIGSLYMFMFREGVESFRDVYGRRWQIKQTTPTYTAALSAGVFQKNAAWVSGLAQTGETVTFNYTISTASNEWLYGYNNWGFGVGDILIDNNTGAILVVTAKTLTSGSPPPASGGVFAITAVQQNCYTNYPGGSWTTTTVLSNGNPTTVPTSGGQFNIIRTMQVFPQRVYFGDFTSGSPNVANIHIGDNDGSTAATYLLAGTLLFAPGLRSTATPQAPIATEFPVTKNTYIGVVTNGTTTTGATMTLVAADGATAVNAVNTGRYPITPIGISQGV